MFKKYWWLMLGILLLILLFWLPKNKIETNKETVSNYIAPTLGFENNKNTINFLETLKKVETINWNTEIIEDYPKKVKKIIVKRKAINEERENEIKNYFGINQENGYFIKDQNYIQYTNMPKDIDKLPITANWEIGELKNKLRKIVSDVNKEIGIKIEWTSTSYRKYNQPYMIESSQNEAQFLEISGDYVVNETRLTTFHGEAIKAYFDGQGNLLKISIYLKPDIVSNDDYWEIKTLEEAKKSSIENYRAGVNDLYEDIEKVNITQVSLVQIYDNVKEDVGPFFLLQGNTFSTTEQKPVNIPVLLNAKK